MITLEIGVSFGDGSVDDRIEPEGYVESGYVQSGYVQSVGRGFDVIHVEDPETDVVVPVDTTRLHSGGYAVVTSSVGNTADTQIHMAPSVVIEGQTLSDVSSLYPTWIRLRMRPLTTSESLVRVVDSAGQLLVGPMGVDLG